MDPITLAILLAAAGGLWYVDRKAKQPAGAPPPATIPPGSSGSNPPPGVPAPVVPAPTPVPAPQPAPVLPPGAYPAGTPGAVPLQVSMIGGDTQTVTALPGGVVGPYPMSKTLWYAPGTRVLFTATVLPNPYVGQLGNAFIAFDHWEGPNGVQSRQNPIVLTINGPGFVRGVFAFFGVVGR